MYGVFFQLPVYLQVSADVKEYLCLSWFRS